MQNHPEPSDSADAEDHAVGELSSHLENPQVRASLQRYWRTNLRWTVALLLVWAAVGLGCGILIADFLNQTNLAGTGYPLGFWFAQQGSILVFVLLILTYCIVMNRLDAKHHRELADLVEADGDGS